MSGGRPGGGARPGRGLGADAAAQCGYPLRPLHQLRCLQSPLSPTFRSPVARTPISLPEAYWAGELGSGAAKRANVGATAATHPAKRVLRILARRQFSVQLIVRLAMPSSGGQTWLDWRWPRRGRQSGTRSRAQSAQRPRLSPYKALQCSIQANLSHMIESRFWLVLECRLFQCGTASLFELHSRRHSSHLISGGQNWCFATKCAKKSSDLRSRWCKGRRCNGIFVKTLSPSTSVDVCSAWPSVRLDEPSMHTPRSCI